MEGRLEPVDQEYIRTVWTKEWGLPVVSTRRSYEPEDVQGMVWRDEWGEVQGLITWHIEGDEAEFVTVDAFQQGRHIGGRLLDGAEAELRQRGVKRLRIVTTNDNLRAVAFYVRRGYRLMVIDLNGVDRVRKFKPSVPLLGNDNIPLRDMYELEKELAEREEITFRRLTEGDLPTLHLWLNNPAVAEWYGLSVANIRKPPLEDVVEHYLPRVHGESPTTPYIMLVDGEPFGYIQCYRLGDYAQYAAALAMDEEEVGIDMLIGEDAYRDRGLGAASLRRFLAEVVFQRPGARRAIIAPDEENKRGIRSYEKAGFRHVKTVFIAESGEHEYVMVLSREAFEASH